MRTVIRTHSLTFGADPEVGAFYVKDGVRYVQPSPHFRLELGEKAENPNSKHPIYYDRYGVSVIEDGVAFEFNIPATRNHVDMFENIQHALGISRRIASKHGYGISLEPTLNYEIERFLDVDDDYKMMLEFGCDPDKDAILKNYVCKVIDAMRHPYRYFGGHFQVGCGDPRGRKLIQTHYEPFIKLCSIFIGNSVMARSTEPKLEKIRAELYGQPGRYRIQPWGIEYRTPSNSWINNKQTLSKMFRGASLAFELLQNPKAGKAVINEFLSPTVTALTMADSSLSQEVLEGLSSRYEF